MDTEASTYAIAFTWELTLVLTTAGGTDPKSNLHYGRLPSRFRGHWLVLYDELSGLIRHCGFV